eukprot:10496972-Karenia_brevis.AAC.1
MGLDLDLCPGPAPGHALGPRPPARPQTELDFHPIPTSGHAVGPAHAHGPAHALASRIVDMPMMAQSHTFGQWAHGPRIQILDT